MGNRDRQPLPAQPGRRNDRQNDPRDDRRYDKRDDQRNGWQDARGNRGAGTRPLVLPRKPLAPNYRTDQYVVEDWRGHGLYSPPHGYHGVQTGSDYVLVAIATGIILELLLGR